jgi:hypothetical protein
MLTLAALAVGLCWYAGAPWWVTVLVGFALAWNELTDLARWFTVAGVAILGAALWLEWPALGIATALGALAVLFAFAVRGAIAEAA